MKKAEMAPEYIAALILVLVFFGVVAMIIAKIDDGTKKQSSKALCKQSVILNAKGRLPVLSQQEFTLECPTQYVTIQRTQYSIQSGTDSPVKYKFKKGDGLKLVGDLSQPQMQKEFLKQANTVVGKLLYDCWDQFMQGRIRILDAYDENRQCVLCSRFEFSEEVKEAFMKETNGLPLKFTEFANENNPNEDYTLDNHLRQERTYDLGKNITLYQYLLDPIDAYQLPTYDYTFQEPYAIVFSAMNENNVKSKFSGAWEWIKEQNLAIPLPFTDEEIPIATGGDSDTPEQLEFVNVLDLIPYSEVKAHCDTLE